LWHWKCFVWRVVRDITSLHIISLAYSGNKKLKPTINSPSRFIYYCSCFGVRPTYELGGVTVHSIWQRPKIRRKFIQMHILYSSCCKLNTGCTVSGLYYCLALCIRGPYKWTLLLHPINSLSYFSVHFSLIYLTHMHNFIRNVVQTSYILMVQNRLKFKNEGFHLLDKINVFMKFLLPTHKRTDKSLVQRKTEFSYLTTMWILWGFGGRWMQF
jgi:hypothetical protein